MGSGLCSGDRSVWKLSGWLSAWCRDMPELCLLEPWRNGGECFGKDKNEVPEGISYYPQLHWYGWDDLKEKYDCCSCRWESPDSD